jgi:NitT/TauT family transport system permease protein
LTTGGTTVGNLSAVRLWRPRPSDTIVLPLITIAITIGLWQLLTSVGLGGVFKDISNPVDVGRAGWKMATDGMLWPNVKVSIDDFAIGFALSAAVGIPLGLVMGWFKIVREVVEPPLMALNSMPKLALMPIAILWFGIGYKSVVAVVFLDSLIPVTLNGIAGIREIDAKLVQASRSFGARRLTLFTRVLLPSATPAIMTGLRHGISRGVGGVVTAQLFVSTPGGGIGYLLIFYGQSYVIAPVIFLVLMVGVFAYLVNVAMERLERRFDSWRPQR